MEMTTYIPIPESQSLLPKPRRFWKLIQTAAGWLLFLVKGILHAIFTPHPIEEKINEAKLRALEKTGQFIGRI
ncbi:MAG: hypothetical protein AB7G93_13300 [Bdellovibrionales bacterium]